MPEIPGEPDPGHRDALTLLFFQREDHVPGPVPGPVVHEDHTGPERFASRQGRDRRQVIDDADQVRREGGEYGLFIEAWAHDEELSHSSVASDRFHTRRPSSTLTEFEPVPTVHDAELAVAADESETK